MSIKGPAVIEFSAESDGSVGKLRLTESRPCRRKAKKTQHGAEKQRALAQKASSKKQRGVSRCRRSLYFSKGLWPAPFP